MGGMSAEFNECVLIGCVNACEASSAKELCSPLADWQLRCTRLLLRRCRNPRPRRGMRRRAPSGLGPSSAHMEHIEAVGPCVLRWLVLASAT